MTDITNKQKLWQSRIENCKNSSMSAKQWCQENQIAYSTYSYWVRKLRSETIPEQKFFFGGTSICTASIRTGYFECFARNTGSDIHVSWKSMN